MEVYWYKFRKVMTFGDAVDYKYYEYKPSDIELNDEFKKFEAANPGPSLLIAYLQIEKIDSPPEKYINEHLADAELRRATAEHEVKIFREELRYQKEEKS